LSVSVALHRGGGAFWALSGCRVLGRAVGFVVPAYSRREAGPVGSNGKGQKRLPDSVGAQSRSSWVLWVEAQDDGGSAWRQPRTRHDNDSARRVYGLVFVQEERFQNDGRTLF